MNEKAYQLALSFIPGIGDILIKQLISYIGSAEAVFSTSNSKLRKIPGIGEKIAESLKNTENYFRKAEEEYEKVQKAGGVILCYTDKDYPKKLKEINDAPCIVYYKGNGDLNNPKVISIVGTRSATSYGKRIVEEIISGVKDHNPLIVSGLAYGIDIHAHKTALNNGLETIGIMASGIDIIYPGIHRKIASQMIESGGIMTEYLTETKPDAPHFPTRNRIIAGMADAVIVVEAAERGGALITAELANGYNREVFAVPGDLHSSYSEGCNKLIRNHKASILTNPKDIEYLLSWPESDQIPDEPVDLTELNEQEKNIIRLLQSFTDGLMVDELSWKSQIPINQLASILLNLEFSGLIVSLPGKKYKLNLKSLFRK